MKDYNLYKKYFIFDIDRTILCGTSWYYACTCPDLLISRDKIDKFVEWNENLFQYGTIEQKKEFRTRTLEILEKKVTPSFVKLIENIELFKGMFKEGDDITDLKFYAAGYYTSRNLIKVDENAVRFINFVKKFYKEDGEIIFLSAGYQPFMRGIVESIIELYFSGCLNHKVVGSELNIYNANISEKYYLSQNQKYEYGKKCKKRERPYNFWQMIHLRSLGSEIQ